MVFGKEFDLLRKVFRKRHVRVVCTSKETKAVDVIDDMLLPFFRHLLPEDASMDMLFGGIKPKTLYRFQDRFSLCYRMVLLSEEEENGLVLIGPYTHEPLNADVALEISERNGIAPRYQKLINEFIMAVPLVKEDSTLFLLLDTFCEGLWQGKFETMHVQNAFMPPEQITVLPDGEREIDDTFLNMKNMERRYQFENEMMDAVTMGLEYKATQMLAMFTENSFEKRLADPLRNFKNYGVIMNTLLRKAAERGGVHPVHLDRISSRFATEIEKMTSLHQNRQLMAEMFRDYCRLVKKHNLKAYSPIVKQAVIAIESDPSAEMTLHVLAKELKVSGGYLSTVFKKETGKTVTEYIREKRIFYAMHLLENTSLQIQTVAQHCGMPDVQYFSKLFKRHTGKTPTQYRTEVGASVQNR